MEPASILAFIVAGLQTARFVHNTLSSVRDAPGIVRNAADYALQLLQILERCKRSGAADRDGAVALYAMNCIGSINRLAERIRKALVQPGDGVRARARKRFRAVMGETDLHKFCAEIDREISRLQLRLQISESDVLFETRNAAMQSRHEIKALGDRVRTATNLYTATIAGTETNVIASMSSGFASLEQRMEGLSTSTADAMRLLLDMLASMQTSIKASVEAQTLVQASLANMTSATISKMGMIDNLIQRLDEQSAGIHDAPAGTQHAPPDMIASIKSLCALFQHERRSINTHRVDDELADAIISHMDVILCALTEAFQQSNTTPSTDLHRQDDSLEETRELTRALRRFNRSFGTSKLVINSSEPTREAQSHQFRLVRRRNFSALIENSLGKFHFMHRTQVHRARPNASSDRVHQDFRARNDSTDYTMRVLFLPHDASRFHILAASTLQHELPGGSVSSISRLDVNRVLPAGSPVFEAVEEGRFEDFCRMLDSGEASVRDHDEFGASLLFYAHSQPKICAFLVSQGLDVDCMANIQGCDRMTCEIISYPLRAPYRDRISAYLRSQRSACGRILLTAGADPTLPVRLQDRNGIKFEFGSFLENYLLDLYHAFFRLFSIIRRAVPFMDNYGLCELQHFKSYFRERNGNILSRKHEEAVSTLLKLGFVRIIRSSSLNTSILAAFKSVVTQPLESACIIHERKLLELLVNGGADVRARDSQGRSVSQLAYRRARGRDRFIGSCRGDLWDSVLQRSGYDLAEFRKGHARRAEYTGRYTRQDFEQLWRGLEHLSPYWNDRPWTPPDIPESEDSEWESYDDEMEVDEEEAPPAAGVYQDYSSCGNDQPGTAIRTSLTDLEVNEGRWLDKEANRFAWNGEAGDCKGNERFGTLSVPKGAPDLTLLNVGFENPWV